MFLTKDLMMDWKLGEQYFMQNLIDGCAFGSVDVLADPSSATLAATTAAGRCVELVCVAADGRSGPRAPAPIRSPTSESSRLCRRARRAT